MNTTFEKKDGKLLVTLSGRLDTNNAQALNEELGNKVPDNIDLVIDLKDLKYISSAGLRVLLSWKKKQAERMHSMTIINVQEDVYEILEVTGFTEIFGLEQKE